MKLTTLTEKLYAFVLVKSLLCRHWNFDDTSIFQENCDSGIYLLAVTYPGRLGARYTGLGTQTLAPKKSFLTSFFSVAIQKRNTLKKSKWLRRQKINRRR